MLRQHKPALLKAGSGVGKMNPILHCDWFVHVHVCNQPNN